MTESAEIEKRRETTRRSVTRDNPFPIDRGGGYFQILVPSVQPQTGMLPAFLPLDFRQRDRILDSTVRADAMWSAAIGIAITKAAALAWETKSDTEGRSKRAQELLLTADATSISGIGGWVSYMGKQVRNFTCTNAGCFTEIIRATGAYGSRIVGLGHLSALRMRRTGDPEYPFIYIDRWGRQHIMRWWQVFNLVDMPDPDEAALGVGLCAAERAYQQIRKLAALEMYLYEKISGSRPLALHIVNGLTKDQLTDMMASASENQASKGLSLYMGAIVATTLKPDSPPALVTIPLAELPDGFEAATERDRADLIYANSLGLDPQDLKPMSNQQMGAGAQSEVLNQKAEGRGQAAYRQQLTHMLNQLVFDNKTQFLFTEHDYRDQQAAANVSAARGTFVTGLVAGGVISAPQGQQVLVEQGELPKAFIEQGAQAGSDLSDTDKPDVQDPLNDQSGPPQPTAQPVMQQQAPVTPASGAGTPSTRTSATVPPLVPKKTSNVAQPQAVLQQKAVSAHNTQHRSVQAGARRILRQLRSGGQVSTKAASAGVWRTINGHPVLIGGGGGGGSGGSGGGGTGASATTSDKKKAKTYVPKPSAGGSSIYPTLDAYKKGTLSHADTLVALKADIKAAKLAGNSKAVNSLTSHYYAIKNGPHAGAPATASPTLGGMGKPAPKAAVVAPSHSMALTKVAGQYSMDPSVVHEAALIQHAYTSGEVKIGEYDSKMAALAVSSGHKNYQLTNAANDALYADPTLGKTGTLKPTTTLPSAGQTAATPPVGATAADKAAAPIKDIPKGMLPGTKPLVDRPEDVPGAKFAALEGTPLHTHAQGLDQQIQSGVASHNDVQAFHDQVKSELALQTMKVDAAEASTKSALAAGQTPLPSIVKMNNEALDKIDALQALDKHIAVLAEQHLPKTPTLPKLTGVSDDSMQTVMNINNLYSKGTISLGAYDTLMNGQATKLGVSKHALEKAIDSHVNGGQTAATAPTHVSSPASGISGIHIGQAQQLAKQKADGTITGPAYQYQMMKLAKQAGVPKDELTKVAKGTPSGLQKTANPLSSLPSGSAAKVAAMPVAKQDLIKLGAVYDQHGGNSAEYKAAIEAYNVKHGASLTHMSAGPAVKEVKQEAGIGPTKPTTLGLPPGSAVGGFSSPIKSATKEFQGQQYEQKYSQSEADAWGNQHYMAWRGTLTSGEKEAFIGYSKHGDGPINNFLRKGELGDESDDWAPQKPSTVHKRIKHLDDAIAKTSVPENIVATRGFTHAGLEAMMAKGQDLKGAVFHDNAYVSTSINSQGGFSGGIKMRIHVPKGSKGAYMAGNTHLTKYPNESELLLGRDSNFRIVGYHKPTNAWAPWEVEVEYLGTGPMPAGSYKAQN